jgi:hypothetical protein
MSARVLSIVLAFTTTVFGLLFVVRNQNAQASQSNSATTQ